MNDKYDVYDEQGRKIGTAERIPSGGEQATGLALFIYLFWKPLLALAIIFGVIATPFLIIGTIKQQIEEANNERAWQETQDFRKQRSQELIIALNNEVITAYRTGEMDGVRQYLLLSDPYYALASDIEQLRKNNLHRDLILEDVQFVNFEFGTPDWVRTEVTVIERWSNLIKNANGEVLRDDSEQCTRTYYVWFDLYPDQISLEESNCET